MAWRGYLRVGATVKPSLRARPAQGVFRENGAARSDTVYAAVAGVEFHRRTQMGRRIRSGLVHDDRSTRSVGIADSRSACVRAELRLGRPTQLFEQHEVHLNGCPRQHGNVSNI